MPSAPKKARLRRADEAVKTGSVFVASDFADITGTKRISEYLMRLSADGTVKSVMRGVFYKPEYSRLLDEYTAPAPDAVAHALARNFGWTVFPCGDTALKALGKDSISNDTKEKIKEKTSPEERTAMLSEAKHSTAWIYEIIKTICR